MRLSNSVLGGLGPDVAVPSYDRSAVGPGIVHLGTGAFHRAHQAVFVDDCLAAGETGWGIAGVSLRSAETRDALGPQDCLYTLALRDSGNERLRVVGSISSMLVAPESPQNVLAALVDPRIRIVTLTITEKGYAADLATGRLRLDHPDITNDLRNPRSPRSALGFLAEALAQRKASGVPPFTILSCDNLPKNGRTLRRILTEFAEARGGGLAAHVDADVDCPSSMVDRIVPATTDADRAAISERIGATDAWPVLGEPFSQWVIEDRFRGGRPMLERSGVQFVADVEPFEHMKLRLLNGAHSSLAAIGRLAGYETVAEAIAQPLVRAFIENYWRCVTPTLAIGSDEASGYTRRLVERFGNISLQHRTAQIAGDASQKLPQRILAPLRDCLDAGMPSDPLIFAVAAWIRSCGGADDAGRPLPLNDPTFEAWPGKPDQRAASPAEVVRAFLTLGSVFGEDLPGRAAFTVPLQEALAAIARDGVLGALRRQVGDAS